jgi:uncharacterized small protein (DUF1192 family)
MAIQSDDEPLRKLARHEVGQDLSALSIEEIDARLLQLQVEIERLQQERARKQAVRGAADALFRKG